MCEETTISFQTLALMDELEVYQPLNDDNLMINGQ